MQNNFHTEISSVCEAPNKLEVCMSGSRSYITSSPEYLLDIDRQNIVRNGGKVVVLATLTKPLLVFIKHTLAES